MSKGDVTKIFIKVSDDGMPALCGTEAIDLGDGTYKVLTSPHYDPEDLVWEFTPGSIVRGKYTKDGNGETIFLAVKKD